MPKITSIEPQKKNSRRFNIYLDGEFTFGADEDLVVDWRLVPGKVLNPSLVERLLFEAEVGKLMERMYRLFSIRQRSEKEVRDYLKRLSLKRKFKGQQEISVFIIDATIQLLKRKGLVNDKQFATDWVESRGKKKGSLALKQELFQKGIEKEVIEDTIGEYVTDYSEEQTAKALLEKKMRIWKNLPQIEFKKKAYEFLMRRGFEYLVVKDIIENFIKKG